LSVQPPIGAVVTKLVPSECDSLPQENAQVGDGLRTVNPITIGSVVPLPPDVDLVKPARHVALVPLLIVSVSKVGVEGLDRPVMSILGHEKVAAQPSCETSTPGLEIEGGDGVDGVGEVVLGDDPPLQAVVRTPTRRHAARNIRVWPTTTKYG
jgi:hypothetical protein